MRILFFRSKIRRIFLSGYFCLFFTTFFFLNENYRSLSAKEIEDYSIRYTKLAEKLRCPTCQGISVKDSDAGFSNIIKSKINSLIKNGKTDKEIINYFVKRYGEWILRSPKKEGFNLILWALPGLGIFFGLLWVFLRFKIMGDTPKEKKIIKLTPEEEMKINEDLKIFERD